MMALIYQSIRTAKSSSSSRSKEISNKMGSTTNRNIEFIEVSQYMQKKTSKQDRFLLPRKNKDLGALHACGDQGTRSEEDLEASRGRRGGCNGRRPRSIQPGVFSADGDEEEPCACKRRTERNLRSS